jgi:hypothetical protein
MGELGGTVEYLYWSTRRTSRFMEDNGLSVQPITRTLTSPSLGWLPTFSRSSTSVNGTRPQIAKAIESALGQIAVTRFNAPGPIQYAKGTGPVVFGEFMGMSPEEGRPAVMFTTVDYSRRDRGSVFVCLFGSMDNFPEYVQVSGPRANRGWTSSAARAVFHFIKSHGKELNHHPTYIAETPADMAFAALQIAVAQGSYRGEWNRPEGLDRPWKRAYTYGDTREAQWLAQIYLDVTQEEFEAENIKLEGYGHGIPVRRVLVGAPLWIRTPDPRAVRIYANCDDLDMTPPIRSLENSTSSRRIWGFIKRESQPNENDPAR